MRASTGRRLAAEALGTAFLLAAIVGSGIVTSTDGPASTQLFQHAVAVALALGALIVTFGPVSGAHFNPAVTAVDAVFGGLSARMAAAYMAAQVAGAVAGTVVTHVMFGLPPAVLGTTDRLGLPIAAGEVVATLGLLLVIFGVVRSGRTSAVPAAVGAYIGAAIFFTSSAAFANPAVTLARMLTDTYVAIAPGSVPLFLVAQVGGAVIATALIAWLFRPDPAEAADVVVPRRDRDADPTTARSAS
jgi:glycerol uptake facilitator-like aquaporin